MVGDETVVRRFSVTLISSGLWLHVKRQRHFGDEVEVLIVITVGKGPSSCARLTPGLVLLLVGLGLTFLSCSLVASILFEISSCKTLPARLFLQDNSLLSSTEMPRERRCGVMYYDECDDTPTSPVSLLSCGAPSYLFKRLRLCFTFNLQKLEV